MLIRHKNTPCDWLHQGLASVVQFAQLHNHHGVVFHTDAGPRVPLRPENFGMARRIFRMSPVFMRLQDALNKRAPLTVISDALDGE